MVRKGDDSAGLAHYLTPNWRALVLAHLASDTPQAAAQEKSVAASLLHRLTKPVLHLALSYAVAEEVMP